MPRTWGTRADKTDARPTLDAILKHRWFVEGEFPSRIPITAMDTQPLFRDLSPTQSRRNFQAVCQKAKIGVELPIYTDTARTRTALGPSILQQERDFRSAIQPDSPVSALLKCVELYLQETSADNQVRKATTCAGASTDQRKHTASQTYCCRCPRYTQSGSTWKREHSRAIRTTHGYGQRRRGRRRSACG